jgi:hypothetical protein
MTGASTFSIKVLTFKTITSSLGKFRHTASVCVCVCVCDGGGGGGVCDGGGGGSGG